MRKLKTQSSRGLRGLLTACVDDGGFTLAELLVFLAIMIILLIGVGGMISSGAKSSATSYNLSVMESAANEAIVSITRQVRVATAINPGSNASSLTFTGYLDGRNVSTVTFALRGGSITRNDTPWIDDVESLEFTYFNQRGERLNPGAAGWNRQVRRVDFELVFTKDALGTRLSRVYRGTVTLRNDLDQA